jgi:pimeloyl-ACP methyl ester carboxylesterase
MPTSPLSLSLDFDGLHRQPNRRRAAQRLLLAGGAASLLGACAVMGAGQGPKMDMIIDDGGCTKTQAPTLLVFLPGANMEPAELVREGFVAAVRRQGLALDLMLPDASLKYVFDGSMKRRLEEEVFGLARARGYQHIWVAGISMGGYLAMAYAAEHPDELEGVLAMAPYVGRRPLLEEIEAAGGPAVWRRTQKRTANAATSSVTASRDELDRTMWMWLADPTRRTPLWLSYGSEDRLGPGIEVLANSLPTGRVQVAPGGHDWPPWRTLWARWLQDGPLKTLAAAPGCGA